MHDALFLLLLLFMLDISSCSDSAIVAMPSSHQVDVPPSPLRVEALLRFYYLWMCVAGDVHCIQIIGCAQRAASATK